MKRHPVSDTQRIQRITDLSLWFSILFFLFFCSGGIISLYAQMLEWEWLRFIVGPLLVLSLIIYVTDLLIPFMLILRGVPWLAYAWSQAPRLLLSPNKTLEQWWQISRFKKLLFYIWAIFVFVFVLLAVVGWLLDIGSVFF